MYSYFFPFFSERPCTPNPCMNGGTCYEEGNNKTCICTKWTKGETCSSKYLLYLVTSFSLQYKRPNGRDSCRNTSHNDRKL